MNCSHFVLLHRFPFSESSIIAKGYDDEFGKLSFMVKGSKRAKSNLKLDYFNLYQVQFRYQAKKKFTKFKSNFCDSAVFSN